MIFTAGVLIQKVRKLSDHMVVWCLNILAHTCAIYIQEIQLYSLCKLQYYKKSTVSSGDWNYSTSRWQINWKYTTRKRTHIISIIDRTMNSVKNLILQWSVVTGVQKVSHGKFSRPVITPPGWVFCGRVKVRVLAMGTKTVHDSGPGFLVKA